MLPGVGGWKLRSGEAMTNPTTEEALGIFWIFDGLSPSEMRQIADAIEVRTHPAGHVLFRQGEAAEAFYLVSRGAVEVVGRDSQGKVVLQRRVEEGDFVGHRSLLEDTPRRATATVASDSELLVLGAPFFRGMIASWPQVGERLRRTSTVNRLLATPLFSCFSREQLLHIADLATVRDYPAGQVIFAQGEPPDAFYVIDWGQVEESASGPRDGAHGWPKYLTAGSFFGRRDLLRDTPRRATARAITDVRLFRFSAEAFHWLCQLEPTFRQRLTRPDILGYLQQVPLFAHLYGPERKRLTGFVGLARFPMGETLYRQGELDPTLYILYEGEAVVRAQDEEGRSRPVGYLQPGDAIGEHSLLLREPRDATVEPVTDSNWFYLTGDDLDQFLSQVPEARKRLAPRREIAARQQQKRLPWMEVDEQFVFRERRHWIVLLNGLLAPLLLALFLLLLLAFDLPLPCVLPAVVVAGLWALWRAVDWANDYYIITTKRVAHREKVLGISERRDETPLDKVQNVNTESWWLGNLLDFGTLVIDTAAAAGVSRVTFDYVGQPQYVQNLILEQVRRLQASEQYETHRAIRDKLERTIGLSVRPVIPKPTVPRPGAAPTAPSGPSLWTRFTEATWRRWLWIEKREGDRVTWRKHWIRLLAKIWLPVLVLSGLLLLLGLLLAQPQRPAGVIALLVVLIIPAVFWLWWNGVNWGNDLYIVTDDRIIDTEALPLGFRTQRTETTFDRIQNVNYDIPHPIATLLNYGMVAIYTAGAEGRLDFLYVRDPKGVQAEIFRRLMAYEARQRQRQREQRWAEMPQWFATYEEMRRS